MSGYLLATIAAILLPFCIETVANLLNLRSFSPDIPAEFSDIFSPERYAQARAYLRAKIRLAIFSHAVVVLTADDDREKTLHAIGYFQGLYGPNNVLVLREAAVEEFSSVTGVIYETFEGRNIAHTFPAVAEEIEASKAEYDQVDDE